MYIGNCKGGLLTILVLVDAKGDYSGKCSGTCEAECDLACSTCSYKYYSSCYDTM